MHFVNICNSEYLYFLFRKESFKQRMKLYYIQKRKRDTENALKMESTVLKNYKSKSKYYNKK